MNKAKEIDIINLPLEFVINNLTDYQKEIICNKFYILNRFAELRNDIKNKYSLQDIYFIISEEIGMQQETIRLMLRKIYKIKSSST
ncbi:MAG: hypothetical protein WC390_07375 [Sulfurimonas sp.]|jgi:hypothetical protein